MQYQEVILEPLLDSQTMPKKWRNTNSTPPHASPYLGVRNAALVVIFSHESLFLTIDTIIKIQKKFKNKILSIHSPQQNELCSLLTVLPFLTPVRVHSFL